MSTIEKLSEYFAKFPGIGPRQAKRFVYFLLTRNPLFLNELSKLISELKKEVSACSVCFRFFSYSNENIRLCSICSNKNRSTETLMIVEKDVDLENIERSGVFQGRYFVLGGSVPILEKEPGQRIREKDLVEQVKKHSKNEGLKEIVFALSNNPEGDNTARYINELLIPLSEKYGFSISVLGRGLSTGTELEYSDSETIKDAFRNRR